MGTEYKKSCEFDRLYAALRKCKRGVIWKDSVAGFVANGLANVYRIEKSLQEKTYKLDGYVKFMVHEPKDREILSTRIKDRVFQRSLCDNVVYPQITRSFIYDNCACQIGKGVDFALDRLNCHLQKYFRKHGKEGWVLKCDIKKYFASTRHDIAKAAVSKRIDDEEAIIRVHEIIESYGQKYWEEMLMEYGVDGAVASAAAERITITRTRMVAAKLHDPERKRRIIQDGKEIIVATVQSIEALSPKAKEEAAKRALTESARGIGLGSQCSQLIELAVLDDMDHFIKETLKIKHYIRYMDDFILIHPEREYTKYCLAEIRKYVESIGLRLNEKTEIHPLRRGVVFLRWHFYLTDTGKVIRKMSRKSIVRERRRLKKLKSLLDEGRVTMKDIEANIQSWCANAERGNTREVVMRMKKTYDELFKGGEKSGNLQITEAEDQGTGTRE